MRWAILEGRKFWVEGGLKGVPVGEAEGEDAFEAGHFVQVEMMLFVVGHVPKAASFATQCLHFGHLHFVLGVEF